MTGYSISRWQSQKFLASLTAIVGFFCGVVAPVDQLLEVTGFQPQDLLASVTGNSEPVLFAESNLSVKQAVARFTEEHHKRYNYVIPPQFQGKTITHVSLGNNDRKVVALTFDDGPSPYATNQVLYILKEHNIKATFFLLGINVKNFPGRAIQIVQHGHAIANHTWNHPYHNHTEQAAARQIENTADLLYQVTGVKTPLFRPPGGYLNNGLVAYAQKKNYVNVMWSADSQDYRASKATMLRNVFTQVKPGGIILMHDGGGDRYNTVAVLPYLITELKKQGYEFVTVPELLEMENP